MNKDFRIAIVGGGIGGLFAANALLSKGFQVSVYEQAPALGEIGAGVFMTPNSVRQMQRIGLGDEVHRKGGLVGTQSRYYRHDGTPIAGVQTTDSSGWNATYGMHRADLVDMLARNLPEGLVRTGHACSGFEQDEGSARVRFENGAVAEAELVIAADGIHSTLQRHVVPPSTPVFSGSVAYRGTIPHARHSEWPTDRWEMWLGEKKHFLVFPLRAGEIINFVGFVPADAEMRESWSAPGDPDQLRAEFAGWDDRLTGLLSKVDHTFRWGLYDREPLTRWFSGRLALLGDAAHPMLPHLGQGANQSIEDGMALATILAEGTSDLTASLSRYQDLRLARVADVQINARKNGMRYDSHYTDLSVRDAEISAHHEFRKSLYDYDVLAHVR
ncbi:FAD-dependent monooxygenase [Anianabacter salinae]|uniref:FAD-dependent monooxygenase n=1 Tax=Anianabacter salinae TaxID=2851023 RepID=UPI00225DEE44|nr:FAD-dependent monooxygenase [Anianabacter salinae]MBV0913824.1 FAD-dependent monooxygenase [Anianabacter salinae]